MKTWVIYCFLLICCGFGFAQETYIHCGKMFDSTSGKMVSNVTIIVEGKRIKAIKKGYKTARKDAKTINLKQSTVLPGLIDLHVHLDFELSPVSYNEGFHLNTADFSFRSTQYAKRTLMAGFTTVRNLGDRENITISMRNSINKEWIVGPRIITAGKTIATTGGHGDPTNGVTFEMMGDPGPKEGVINSVDDAYKAVRQRYKDGADCIKFTATGGVLSVAKSGQNPQLRFDEMKAIIDAAKDYDFIVAAHAHGKEGMLRAIKAGVDTIEHGTYMDQEVMGWMKKMNTWYIPTITAGDFVAAKAKIDGYYPAIVRPKAAAIGPQIQATFTKAYKAGVNIAFGTDSGVSPHGENWKEFVLMVKGGMKANEALQAATIKAAMVLKKTKDLGSLDEGKLADIVALKGDPLQDISQMEHIFFVMKEGVVYKGNQ